MGARARSHRTYRMWSDAEIQQWADIVGESPFPLAVRRWNRWAEAQGLPKRSRDSLRHKAKQLGISTLPCLGDWVTIGEIRRLAGRNRTTIQQWVEKGWITRYMHGIASAVRREDLRRMAREHPVALGGCDRGALVQLLEDEALADAVLRRYPRRYQGAGNGQAIECETLHRRFSSYAEAGRKLHMDRHTIRDAAMQGRPACGLVFRLVEPAT